MPTLRTTKGMELSFMVYLETLHFLLLLHSSLVCLFVCIYYTRGCVLAEPNFIVCITLSRYSLIINPELISSNQDRGTNRVTTCQTYFAPSAALS